MNLGTLGLNTLLKNELKKITWPWMARSLGIAKWARERALHAPEAVMPFLADTADQLAHLKAAAAGRTEPNPEDRWRAFEETIVNTLEGSFLK